MAEVKKYELRRNEPTVADYVKHQGGFYRVEGKLIPDAAKVIQEAVSKGFSAEIVDKKADPDGVEVVIRAKTPDGIYTEEWVRMEYKTEAYRIFMQKMLKQVKQSKESGVKPEDLQIAGYVESPWGKIPAFRDPALNIAYQEQLIRAITFLPRIVVTKAKARAFLQLLGREYREDFEIEQEQSEVEEVNGMTAKLITENQLKYLHALIKDYAELRNVSPDVVKAAIKKEHNVEHINELTVDQASEIITRLKTWIDKKKQEQPEELPPAAQKVQEKFNQDEEVIDLNEEVGK